MKPIKYKLIEYGDLLKMEDHINEICKQYPKAKLVSFTTVYSRVHGNMYTAVLQLEPYTII
jgi:hypothetical protein